VQGFTCATMYIVDPILDKGETRKRPRLSSPPADLQAQVAASLSQDISACKAFLEACSEHVRDVEDSARKAVVEACRVAAEVASKSRDNPFAEEFEAEWSGPLPKLLRELVDGDKWNTIERSAAGRASTSELSKRVQTILAAYETAVCHIEIQEQVRQWVAEDVEAFHEYLRDTTDPSSSRDVDMGEVSRKGVVLALKIALERLHSDGDFVGFLEEVSAKMQRNTFLL
jgi:hypothetical protein